MSSKENILLEFTEYLKLNKDLKFNKVPTVIYADLESLIKKTSACNNHLEKSSTTKLGEHTPCDYPMSTICEFDYIEGKHDVCKSED